MPVFAQENVSSDKSILKGVTEIGEAKYNSESDKKINQVDNHKITPFYIPRPDFPGSIVGGPKYQTYENGFIRETADFADAFVTTKIPKPIAKHTIGNWIVSKVTNWSDMFHPTYVGTWITKEWNNF